MKTLLSLLILATTAFAVDPVVVVNSATSVTVNGAEFGKPADVIANNPALAPAVQAALEKWAASVTEEKDDALAERDALKARIDKVLGDTLKDELKTGDGPRAELLRKLITESKKTEKQLKAEALAAEIAAKQAELQQLNAPQP